MCKGIFALLLRAMPLWKQWFCLDDRKFFKYVLLRLIIFRKDDGFGWDTVLKILRPKKKCIFCKLLLHKVDTNWAAWNCMEFQPCWCYSFEQLLTFVVSYLRLSTVCFCSVPHFFLPQLKPTLLWVLESWSLISCCCLCRLFQNRAYHRIDNPPFSSSLHYLPLFMLSLREV